MGIDDISAHYMYYLGLFSLLFIYSNIIEKNIENT